MSMRSTARLAVRWFAFFSVCSALSLLGASAAAQPADSAGCLACHAGIEPISDTPIKKNMSCTTCHRGDNNGKTVEEAHKGMWANPSDFRVVDQACGTCHREEVANNKKSLHATMAGMISGTRFANGAQKTKGAMFATYATTDDDGTVPAQRGAVKSLQQIPSYDAGKPTGLDNHPIDDYLREQCLRCHLWSGGGSNAADLRASGCAACHVEYSKTGKYEGNDKAIDKTKAGRPKAHRMTRKVSSLQCQACHNRGGRTGVSYFGMMESDEYGSPWGTKAGDKAGEKLHGKFYNHLAGDVHYQKGMACIDCHTKSDLHGDGNMYSKREQAVEIRCESCHGTVKEYSKLTTAWGNVLPNLKRDAGKVVLTTKIDNVAKVVPQVRDAALKGSPDARAAKALAAHNEKLECYACHAKWAPQCYGCHVQQDLATKSNDWINTKVGADPSRGGTAGAREKTAYKWSETRSYLRWESPVLGINSRGKVSPFIPGCQVIFTQIGPDGKATQHNKVFTNGEGYSGLSHAPIQPHTISKDARSCADCHANRKTLGLGSGFYDTKANGVDVPFELERIVDEEGKQLQGISHEGARPFNKAEQQRISRVSACIACHNETNAKVWSKVSASAGKAPSDDMHRAVIQKLLNRAVPK